MAYSKTPLRYPGGKSKALTKLWEQLPNLNAYDEYREPFLGGGSVAIHISRMYPDLQVWVNDLYEPLYQFWRILKRNVPDLMTELLELKEKYSDSEGYTDSNLFYEKKEYLEKPLTETTPMGRAVAFYVTNKCSFSGLSMNSSYSRLASKQNFKADGIKYLPEFSKLIQKWTITNFSYERLLSPDNLTEINTTKFLYLDPPYEIKSNLYGTKGDMHKGFSHELFAKDCMKCDIDQLISYNDSNIIEDRFEGWTASTYEHTYSLRHSDANYIENQKQRKELLLRNYVI